MKYYKRIDNTEYDGFELNKIYREDENIECVKVRNSVHNFPERWKEVTKKYYLRQKHNFNMKQFQVKVTPTTSAILQKIAFDNGWCWPDNINKVKYTNSKYIQFWDDYRLTRSSDHYNNDNFPVVSLTEAIERIVNELKPISIGPYAVTITNTHIKVGCDNHKHKHDDVMRLLDIMDIFKINHIRIANIEVDKETVEKIVNRL